MSCSTLYAALAPPRAYLIGERPWDIGATIDWAIRFGRDARWDVVSDAMRRLEASFSNGATATGERDEPSSSRT